MVSDETKSKGRVYTAKLPAALIEARSRFDAPIVEPVPASSEVLDIELDKSGDTPVLRLSERVPGNAGVQGYGPGGGVANNFDRKPTYAPYRARGMSRDFGLYHQAYLDSAAYQRGLSKIVEGLTTGFWSVEAVACHDEETQELADLQALYVQDILFGISGGWSKHVLEALQVLVYGFAPFCRVTDAFGQLKKLSFRYPSQIYRWITDEHESEFIAAEFYNGSRETSDGVTYVKAAGELLVYQFNAVGNNFEGISPMRGVLKFMMAYDLLQQLEMCAAEKFGCPVTFVERPPGAYDKVDDDRLIEVLDAFTAADNAVILLPGGYKVTVASPAGQIPDFEPAKRYLDEQIALALTAEGMLVGLSGVGAYNVAEMKDEQALRTLAFYAKFIADAINGTNVPHNGVIEQIVDHLAVPELRTKFTGKLPKLRWSLSPEQDDTPVDQIVSAKTGGLLTWSPEDEDMLRKRLKLRARVRANTSAASQQGGQ